MSNTGYDGSFENIVSVVSDGGGGADDADDDAGDDAADGVICAADGAFNGKSEIVLTKCFQYNIVSWGKSNAVTQPIKL